MRSWCPILVLGLLLGPGMAQRAAALSLYDVIQLAEGGYAEHEIVRVLEATNARFELDAKGLIALRKAEVPTAVLHRMLDDGGMPDDEYSALTAAQIQLLRNAAVADETILKFARHRNACEGLSAEDADQLRQAGFDDPFLNALADLVATCQQARMASLPAAPEEAGEATARTGVETAHRVIIRDDPYWNPYYHDRYHRSLYHSHRRSHWYPVYIYRDHRHHRGHLRDHGRFRDRHRWERRHRGDRERRPRHRKERRGRAERSAGEPGAARRVTALPLPADEPWVSSHARPLNRESSRLTRRSVPAAVEPPRGAPTVAPRPPARTVSASRPASPPRRAGLAPGAISPYPIKSAAPAAGGRPGTAPSSRLTLREGPRAKAAAMPRPMRIRDASPAFVPVSKAPPAPAAPPKRPAPPKPMLPKAPAHDDVRVHR